MDIATYYLVAVHRLRDMQDRQMGPRAKKGSSPGGRVRLAHGDLSLAEERLRRLAQHDPDKARQVCEWLRTLVDPSALAMARDMERELERLQAQ